VGTYEELMGLERRETVSSSLETVSVNESFAACNLSILVSTLARRDYIAAMLFVSDRFLERGALGAEGAFLGGFGGSSM
jgi:hypothetical protein